MTPTTPQRRTSERITPELIEQYRTWTPEAAAQVYDRRLREIERSYDLTFTELQLILVECETRRLWKYAVKSDGEVPKHLSDWITNCLPVSNGTAFSALKCGRQLAGIPVEEREQMPRATQETMASMSSGLAESVPIRQAAVRLKPKNFRDMIERDHPQQYIETLKLMRFNPQRSARKIIDEALEIAMELEECGRDEALEKICQVYIEDNRQRYREALMEKKFAGQRRSSAVQ